MSLRYNRLFALPICLLLLVGNYVTIAQQAGGIFYHLTTKNGLSSNHVKKIIQDKEGFYWIATDDGLNRFDGSNCKIFRNVKNDTTSLSSNNCLNLLEDDYGDIWVTTARGVNRYLKKEGKFERFHLTHPTFSPAQVNTISAITKDEEGNVWMAFAGLWRFNIHTRRWTLYLNNPNDLASIPPGFYSSLQYDKFTKTLWMTGSGFVVFDIAASKFFHAQFNPKQLAIFNNRPADEFFALDSTGGLWFHRYPRGSLCRYSLRDNTIRVYMDRNPSGGIRNLSVDAKNRLWISRWNSNTWIFDPSTNAIDTSFLASFHQQSPPDRNRHPSFC